MKLLFAPDSFKGSASSEHVIALLTETAKKYFEDCEIIPVPMADGGEGTMDTLVSVMGGRYEMCDVPGPLGSIVKARYGVLEDQTVIVEMAEASGLTLVERKDRNPCKASSYGTGAVIRCVLEKGYRNIFLAIGGSATNDGGIGAAEALGIHFLDVEKKRLQPIGENLGKIEEIQLDEMIPELKEAKITVVCDVQNPLLGKKGSTYVYGPQKGGNKKQLDILEAGMTHYIGVVEKKTGKSLRDIRGIGAAGGISIPFLAFTDTKIRPGIQTILEIIHFEELLEGVDLVVTGEGRVDYQSSYGKVLFGIGNACKRKNVPAVAIVGSMGKDALSILDYGIDSIIPTVNDVMDIDCAIKNADELIKNAAERMFRLIDVGIKIQAKKQKADCEVAMNERNMEKFVDFSRREERACNRGGELYLEASRNWI